ncbi:4-formylbenzenesulfonate dehydrogenase TsaC1/TsaC2 [Aquimixticola soesokkakensis]|uniref:4-formylbenzenesulfonate dehydrogenase TsaC1/TsaC2 n=1 Tax=Aquimixticola soesokkakensis TaxID=1519096 RepID=A0A1Y5SSW9_9RHOB|nr:SDR family oxidoreductase [Aquimixticola soesokkakensis]SLN47778.1 4-formylbenzenesulfonate dehydrogenase TsaC1/TsaC2 [Aquimixticola soesokkakensis]
MSFSIAGKTAIVTGAGNGIGLAIARHLAEAGANVMCADIDEAALIEAMGEEARDEGSNIRFYAGDLRKKLTVTNLMSATIDAFERVDILVNASRQVSYGDPLCAETDGVETLLEQNLMTSLRVIQHVSKWMIKAAEKEGREGNVGSIVNLTTIANQRTLAELTGFSISAAAVDQMTRSMALALAPHGIRVNAVSTGSVMSASLQRFLVEQPEYREQIINHTPLARIASASEVAEAVHFLASEASGFMTGQVITVDGGRTLVDSVPSPFH